MRSAPLRSYALAALAALLSLLPFPLAGDPPEYRRLCAWFCLVPLLFALRYKNSAGQPLSLAQSFLVSYLCGVLWFAGNCYWIYQTMFLYGGLPAPAAIGVLILFSLYLGLYFGLFGLLFHLLARFKGNGIALLCVPFLWVAVELARARITGFPWDLLGTSQVNNLLLTKLAPWAGVMGISLLLAAGNALCLWQPRLGGARRVWVGPACTALLALGTYGAFWSRLPPSPASAVATLVQDNYEVGSQELYLTSQPTMLATLTAASLHPVVSPGAAALEAQSRAADVKAPPTSLILWPEAPTPFHSADPAFRESIGALARSAGAPVIVDADAQDPATGTTPPREYVSASFFLPDGTYAGRYDKMHLVPFGEYTPYKQLFFFAGHLLDGLNFVPGTRRTLFSAAGHRYGVFICYESIFGDEIRHFALGGAQVFANLSDDGWYGDTSAPWEHLEMTRMRAIENGRWVLLDTNTGITASIDPRGRIVARMPRHLRGAVDVPFDYRNDLTFYTRYGDWIGWLSAIVIASVLGGSLLQRRFPYTPERGANQVN